MFYKCPNCGTETAGLYCSNCGTKKVSQEQEDVIDLNTLDDSNSSLNNSFDGKENTNQQKNDIVLVNPLDESASLSKSYLKKQIESMYGLKNENLSVPLEIVESRLGDTDPHSISMRGVDLNYNTDEDKVWSGTPHPLVMLRELFTTLPSLIIAIILLLFLKDKWINLVHLTHYGGNWNIFRDIWTRIVIFSLGIFILKNIIDLSLKFLAIKFTKYKISSQRIEITDGLLHRQIRTYEVHHLGDAVINVPFPLQFVGLSELNVKHKHGLSDKTAAAQIIGTSSNKKRNGILAAPPVIRIFASVPENSTPSTISFIGLLSEEARIIRDILRNAGQNEAGRTDKIRFR